MEWSRWMLRMDDPDPKRKLTRQIKRKIERKIKRKIERNIKIPPNSSQIGRAKMGRGIFGPAQMGRAIKK